MMYAHDFATCAHCGCRIPVANLRDGTCRDVGWCVGVVNGRYLLAQTVAAREREDEAVRLVLEQHALTNGGKP